MQRRGRSRNRKRLPQSDDRDDATSANKSETDYSEEEIEQANSQLSRTLSTAFQPKELICRDEERQKIVTFIKNCLSSEGAMNNRIIYISGVPGVGKTALTKQVVKSVRKTIKRTKICFKYINAMSLPIPSRIYSVLCMELYKTPKQQLRKFPAVTLQKKMQADSKIKMVIIDEVDFLMNKEQSILYTLFQWCNLPQTKLCLIIIANTMDFPERLLPKVTSRMGQNRLVFKPYSQKQVQSIVEQRLSKSNRFTKDAVIYACKKMSSFTSDVRKILDVLRFALEEKVEGQIGIDDIVKCWRAVCHEEGGMWQEQLPEFYRNITNALKQEGGVTWVQKIRGRMCNYRNYSQGQILEGLLQLQSMEIVKLKTKKMGHLLAVQATLLKI